MPGIWGNFAPAMAIQQAIDHRWFYAMAELGFQRLLQRRHDHQLTLLRLGFPPSQEGLFLFEFHQCLPAASPPSRCRASSLFAASKLSLESSYGRPSNADYLGGGLQGHLCQRRQQNGLGHAQFLDIFRLRRHRLGFSD
jgi:hypothetical protein